MAPQNGPDLRLHAVSRSQLKIKKIGRFYMHRRALVIERRAQIIDCYVSLLRQVNGQFVSLLALLRTVEVSWPVNKRLIYDYHSGRPIYSDAARCWKEYHR